MVVEMCPSWSHSLSFNDTLGCLEPTSDQVVKLCVACVVNIKCQIRFYAGVTCLSIQASSPLIECYNLNPLNVDIRVAF